MIFAIALMVAAAAAILGNRHSISAEQADLLATAQRYPRFTLAQRAAVMREAQAQHHPSWRTLSLFQIASRLVKMVLASSSASQPPLAPFFGNLTSISTPNDDFLDLYRQSNCSLTMEWQSVTPGFPSVSYSFVGSAANYDQVLHSQALLKTSGGNWPAGCGDPVVGISTLTSIPMGMTGAGELVAGVGYDGLTQNDMIWTGAGNPLQNGSVQVGVTSPTDATPIGVNAADLNGDGFKDLVSISDAGVTSSGTLVGSAAVLVLLGSSSGTLQAPVNYPIPGDTGLSAVIDDFNGDGKLDIVASSSSYSDTTHEYTYSLSFLAGNGDGTFQTAQSTTLTPPAGATADPYFGLVSANLLGNGKKDLVTSDGIVLIGNGDGTFTQSSTLALTPGTATSNLGPNLAAGDFNKDGKIDLAYDDGQSMQIYLGNGDGTFTPGNGYATINNVGFLYATDLDGDGNVDLYSGSASGGSFGGDQFDMNEAYALMGNGNGTFQGAPLLPFVFTGSNMVDLNGDKILDGVGVNSTLNSNTVSFTSYLGNGNGTFKTGPTLQVSPVTVQGNPVMFQQLDSFGLGDIRGNGDVDLVYLPVSFNWPGGLTGFLLATGNGDGSFNAPVFVQAPTFAPSGDFDDYEYVSNLFVADINGDGKADLVYSYSVAVYQTQLYEQGIAIQLSNGDGTFQSPQVIQTYSSTTAPTLNGPAVVQIGDATGSGKLDLFTETFNRATTSYTLQLYLGNGDGTFGSALTPPVADNIAQPAFGGSVGQIVLADMNGDGKPDLVTLGTANNGNGELAISLGNGDGTFKTPTILDFGVGSTLGYGVSAADFDDDGKVDVEVNGFYPPFDTGIFLGNGDGTLQSYTPSGGGITQPSEAINLFSYGPALVTSFTGNSHPGVIAGQMVLVNLGSSAPTLTPTTTTLASSATSITSGQSVTFTATVTASSTPSGTVTFSDGSTALGMGTLNGSGVATYSTSGLAVGSHSITAAYAGNSTFASSSSTAVTVTVQALPQSFTLSASPASGSVTAGSSAQTTLTVTPVNGFNQQVSFACSGQSNGVTCSFNPPTITPSGGPEKTALTIATTTQSAALARPANRSLQRGLGSGATLAFLAGGALWIFRRRKDRSWLALVIVGLGLTAAGLGGCGGGGSANSGSSGSSGSGSQPQSANYTITVTATAGSLSPTANYTLTVTQ
jgi:hypothetical protein